MMYLDALSRLAESKLSIAESRMLPPHAAAWLKQHGLEDISRSVSKENIK